VEQIWPRIALEYEVTRRIATVAILVTGLALPAPLAFAHGNQFICVCVTIGDDGHVALELTADYGDNPYIADAQEARQVLREALSVRVGGEMLPLELLGELRFEERQQYGDDAPVPSASDPGPHHLVAARWQTRLPDQRILFKAKEHTPLDVVMWRSGEKVSSERSRWMLLIAGDKSPEFIMTPAAVSVPVGIFFGMGTMAVFPLLIWSWIRRRPKTTEGLPS
jgi:hypothetical protein